MDEKIICYVINVKNGTNRNYMQFFDNEDDAKKAFTEHKNGFIEENKEHIKEKILVDRENVWVARFENMKKVSWFYDSIEVEITLSSVVNGEVLSLGAYY